MIEYLAATSGSSGPSDQVSSMEFRTLEFKVVFVKQNKQEIKFLKVRKLSLVYQQQKFQNFNMIIIILTTTIMISSIKIATSTLLCPMPPTM